MNGNLVLIVTCFLYFGSGVNCGVVYNNEVLDEDYFGVQIYKTERVCAMVGGICVQKEDCAEGQLTSTRGLCPFNQHDGVECCYQVTYRPATCKQMLGECMPRCNSALKRPEAIDCPSHTHCCVLV